MMGGTDRGINLVSQLGRLGIPDDALLLSDEQGSNPLDQASTDKSALHIYISEYIDIYKNIKRSS